MLKLSGNRVIYRSTPASIGNRQGDDAILATANQIAQDRKLPVFIITHDKEFLERMKIPVLGATPEALEYEIHQYTLMLQAANDDEFMEAMSNLVREAESMLWCIVFELLKSNPHKAHKFGHRVRNNIIMVISLATRLHEEKLRLLSMNTIMQYNIDIMQEEKSRLEQTIEEYRSRVRELETAQNVLRRKVQEKDTNAHRLHEENGNLRKKLEEMRLRERNLLSQNEKLRRKVESYERVDVWIMKGVRAYGMIMILSVLGLLLMCLCSIPMSIIAALLESIRP